MGMNAEELKKYIEIKLAEREEYYNKAKLIYSGQSINYDHFLKEIKKNI